MPEVSLRTIDQCTIDDPTDGAEPPLVPDTSRACSPAVSGAGGRGGDECTDALVRRFSSEGGAPVIHEPERPPGSPSCARGALDALQACSPLLLSATVPKAYVITQSVSCLASLGSLLECLVKNDAAR